MRFDVAAMRVQSCIHRPGAKVVEPFRNASSYLVCLLGTPGRATTRLDTTVELDPSKRDFRNTTIVDQATDETERRRLTHQRCIQRHLVYPVQDFRRGSCRSAALDRIEVAQRDGTMARLNVLLHSGGS